MPVCSAVNASNKGVSLTAGLHANKVTPNANREIQGFNVEI
jgi:hypothetical protein